MHEAYILGKYLVGKTPSEDVIFRYIDALKKNSVVLSEKEKKLWNFSLAHPWALGCIDAMFALRFPQSNFRKKIYIFLAISETVPLYSRLFLAQPPTRFTYVKIPFLLLRALGRLIMGTILYYYV